VDHIDAVLESDSDNVILSEISSNRSEALADLVCFVGLYRTGSASALA
jgi:hypothetical protein